MRSGVVGNNNKRPFSKKEFQGFAITDTIAPLVFINSVDYLAAKIFTLLHELAHIWIGKSGISNPEELRTNLPIPIVETFCNSVTAEALVSKDEFQTLWNGRADIEEVNKLAKHFLVSSLVIIRRARELNLIDQPAFGDLLKISQSRVTDKKKREGGNFFLTAEARSGSKLFDAVISDVRQGRTMYREAARLLHLKVPTLEKFVEGKNKS